MDLAATKPSQLKARILLIDEEEAIRELMSAMLETAGYTVRQATSGIDALATLNAVGEFDLLLSDMMMPELDGIALLERVREKYPEMPVIMVTAVYDVSVALAAIRNGAYDYLLKPFKREQLLAIVRRALEHRRLRLEDRAHQANLEALVTEQTAQLRQAMDDLERSYDITLEALGDALRLKDPETQRRSKQVTAFSIAIARAMGLSQERIRVIARGVFLHDIGKMAIPDSILRKPGALTAEEAAIMREHCVRGYQVLHKIPFLVDAAEIVYAHQERYDGTGYPRGLCGDAIPLGARIFSVADTLAEMTSDRPHHAARTVASAREEISRLSGSQFDPDVVNTFLHVPDSTWESLRKQIDSEDYRFIDPVLAIQRPSEKASSDVYQ